ncbi:MAG: NAD(P)-dependent oxidoreductase [Ruthenibacterium sp.]
MTKLVILDSYALHEGDLDWAPLQKLADEIVLYPRTKADELIARLADADFAIVNKSPIDDAVLCACPKLKWVGVTATGVDSLDIAACRRHNVAVANVPGYSTQSVAQLSLTLLLALCQCPGRYDAAVRDGYWQLDLPQNYGIFAPMELCGKTCGLIGYGAIGRQMAKNCAALGMRVLCHTRTVPPVAEQNNVTFVSLDMLLRESDVLSLHCPCTSETENILDANNLAKCKKGVRIVNTARGKLVDEHAMAAALLCGDVGGFAADVVRTEPLVAENPLLAAPNVLLTPHIAWTTPEALHRLSTAVVENLESFLAGDARNIVN